MNHAQRLFNIAQELIANDPGFFIPKGPGTGDRATNAFMRNLRDRAHKEFEEDHAEQKICGKNGFSVDYFFRSEATIVEVALGLKNPTSEFERDILKAIMAKEGGHAVERLVFISKPGGKRRCEQPSRAAVIEWLKRNHGIAVEVFDLG